MTNKTRVAFLASGGGGTIKVFAEALRVLDLPFALAGVIADRECGATDYAQTLGVPSVVVDYSTASPQDLRDALAELKPEVVVTTIHKILDSETLGFYPDRFVNVHYSLLPAFDGLIGMSTLEAAREQQVRFVGGTCHVVTAELDAGPILCQAATPVDWSHAEGLEDRVFRATSLAFLNALVHEYGEPSVIDSPRLPTEREPVLFSPRLDSRIAELDEAFWESVKNS